MANGAMQTQYKELWAMLRQGMIEYQDLQKSFDELQCDTRQLCEMVINDDPSWADQSNFAEKIMEGFEDAGSENPDEESAGS